MTRWRFRALFAACVLGAAYAVAAPSEPTPAQKNTARQLLLKGLNEFGANRYDDALRSLQAAHEIMGVPTTGLPLARAQAAMGLLVEARETARQAAAFPVADREPQAFTRARTEATIFEQEVEARIPTIRIRLIGDAGEPTITVDGVEVPRAALALPWGVNPGQHVVRASNRAGAARAENVTLAEGETKEVALELPPRRPSSTAEADAGPPDPIDEEASGLDNVPAWAWIAGSLGVVLAGFAIGFGVDYGNALSEIAEQCPEENSAGQPVCNLAPDHNPSAAEPLFDRRDRSGWLAIVSGAGALAGLTLGIVGIATAPASTESASHARVGPVVGPAWLGLAGTF